MAVRQTRISTKSSAKLRFERVECRLMLKATMIFEPHQIDQTSPAPFAQSRTADAADLDGDGDLDVVTVSRAENLIAWHENEDGKGAFSRRKVISNQTIGANDVILADLDADGKPDVVYAASTSNTIGWHRNLGSGNFGEANLLSTNALNANGLHVADLDNDGDLDVLAASEADDTVGWFANIDGKGTFTDRQVITSEADSARSVFAADLDGDGDLDVLSASARDDIVAWYENEDGVGQFGSRQTISIPNSAVSRANFVSAADLDGDGDLDVLTASYNDKEVSWYENIDGLATFGEEKVLMQDVGHPRPRYDSVWAADIDSDGDLDVVSSAEFGHLTFWVENLDGSGVFAEMRPIGPKSEMTGGTFRIVDLDQDGDLDILAGSDHEGIIAWHENRQVGDSNDDGVFNASDIIRVFQAAEFLDDIPNNSTFDEGDWNLDGDFDTTDLVFAFQVGTYGQASRFGVRNGSLASAVDFVLSQADWKKTVR